MALLDRVDADLQWLRENFSNISQNYGGLFIAIKNKVIMAIGANKEEVIQKLESKHVNVFEVLIDYIPSKNEFILL